MYLQNKSYRDLNVVFDKLYQLLIVQDCAFHFYQKHFDRLRNNIPEAINEKQKIRFCFSETAFLLLFSSFPRNEPHLSIYHIKWRIYQHFDENMQITLIHVQTMEMLFFFFYHSLYYSLQLIHFLYAFQCNKN